MNRKSLAFTATLVVAGAILLYQHLGVTARRDRIHLLAKRHGALVEQDPFTAADVPYSGHADDQLAARFELGQSTFVQMSRGRSMPRHSVRYVLDDAKDFVGVAASFDLSRLYANSFNDRGAEVIDLRLTSEQRHQQVFLTHPLPSLVSLRVTNGAISVSDFPIGRSGVKHLHLKNCRVDGSWLDQVLGTGLQELEFNECDIIEDAAQIQLSSKLRVLTCTGSSAARACLARAARLNNLRGLLLDSSELSKEDCKLIGQLRGLTHLMVGSANLDLPEIEEWDLPNLQVLILKNTHVARDAVPDVKAIFPNARVVVSRQTMEPPRNTHPD